MNLKITILFFLFLFDPCGAQQMKKANKTSQLNELSELFLRKIQQQEDTEEIQRKLANIGLDQLSKDLRTDAQKLAFWINIYNAYIRILLIKNPEFYENRNDFFSKNQFPIAGKGISFDKIEHGILRRSQSKIGMGYVKKGFPDQFERMLRVEKLDYRIHFALNCGAKDCPSVTIYTPDKVDEQLVRASSTYLKRTTDYDTKSKEASVTSLFNWFRGDFGGKNGIKRILRDYGLIETTRGVSLKFKEYDWTLHIDDILE